MDNIHALVIELISTNKAEPAEENWYGSISSNDESANNFTLFALNLFHARFNNTCNYMVKNWHMVTLFLIIYIYIPDIQNNFSMLSHVKGKNL